MGLKPGRWRERRGGAGEVAGPGAAGVTGVEGVARAKSPKGTGAGIPVMVARGFLMATSEMNTVDPVSAAIR